VAVSSDARDYLATIFLLALAEEEGWAVAFFGRLEKTNKNATGRGLTNGREGTFVPDLRILHSN
jgi:hypothetical protein